ncbi:MAG: pseudaminic acid synthase [Magnetospirillum sp.]|nr:pseudaminic acid synthase [Magnetospirillum sp.]
MNRLPALSLPRTGDPWPRPPLLVAELSGNHNGDLGRALALIEAAKDAGADAVKLQTYTADTMTIACDRPEFRISGGLWDGWTLYDLYRWAHTPWEWHQALFDRGAALGLPVFSTPFDETAVDFLEGLGNPVYKIASFELGDHALIAKAARTGKPLVMSTGMAMIDEIAAAQAVAVAEGCQSLTLLHCVSGYPTPSEQSNLRRMGAIARRFGTSVGLSDHTLGGTVAVAATVMGAVMIEKHFTLARADGGPDCAFSMEPAEFASMAQACRQAWSALGDGAFQRQAAEATTVQFRRSLYAVADIEAGEVLTTANVRAIRPGHGLPPSALDAVLGKTARSAITFGTPLAWDMLQ